MGPCQLDGVITLWWELPEGEPPIELTDRFRCTIDLACWSLGPLCGEVGPPTRIGGCGKYWDAVAVSKPCRSPTTQDRKVWTTLHQPRDTTPL